MTDESEREAAMTRFTEAAAEIMRLGTADLSEAARQQLRVAIAQQGARLELRMLFDPTIIEGGVVTPQLDGEPVYTWLFQVETGSPNETAH